MGLKPDPKAKASAAATPIPTPDLDTPPDETSAAQFITYGTFWKMYQDIMKALGENGTISKRITEVENEVETLKEENEALKKRIVELEHSTLGVEKASKELVFKDLTPQDFKGDLKAKLCAKVKEFYRDFDSGQAEYARPMSKENAGNRAVLNVMSNHVREEVIRAAKLAGNTKVQPGKTKWQRDQLSLIWKQKQDCLAKNLADKCKKFFYLIEFQTETRKKEIKAYPVADNKVKKMVTEFKKKHKLT